MNDADFWLGVAAGVMTVGLAALFYAETARYLRIRNRRRWKG